MSLFDNIRMPGPTKYKFECPDCNALVYKPKVAGMPHLRANHVWAIRILDENEEMPSDVTPSYYDDGRERRTTDYLNDPVWLHNHKEVLGQDQARLCYGQPERPYGVL